MTTDPRRSMPVMPAGETGVRLTGWVIFGGIALIIAGTANLLQGITALSYDDFLTSEIIFDSLEFWGWAFLVWGVLQAVAGVLTLMARDGGPVTGMILSGVSTVFWFFMIFSAPGPAMVAIALNVAVVASLATAYGD